MKKIEEIKGLLIYPPTQLMERETARPEGSMGPPYLASSLEKEGIKTDILDATVGTKEHKLKETLYRMIRQDNGLIRVGMSFEEITEHVVKKEYDFVGLSAIHTMQTRMVFETAKAIKNANPEIKIYAGGTSARSLYEKFLKTGLFDGICMTEGELIFPRAIKAHFSRKTLHNIPGFAFMHNNEIIVNEVDSTCFPKSLDDLPMPAWEKLPLDKYEEAAAPHGVDITEKKENRYANILTSRGCVNNCLYCHISTEKDSIGRYRLHSVNRVIQEIDKLKSMGVKKLFFEDDTLFAAKQRAKEIFSIVKDRDLIILDVNGVNISNYYLRKEDGCLEIDKEFIQILKDAGFEQIVFPPESGSQRILDKYSSCKINLEKMNLVELVKTLTEIGIKAPVNLMFGFPDETEEEIMKTIQLGFDLKKAGAPYVSFFFPTPFPGSKLYEIALQEGYLDKDFNTDTMTHKLVVMKNMKVSPERLMEIREKSHIEINGKDFDERMYKRTVGYKLEHEKD